MTDTRLDSNFKQFVSNRCEAACLENDEYMKMEHGEDVDQDELQALAEELCYRKGFQDAMAIIKNN